jgi:hypothetical protein
MSDSFWSSWWWPLVTGLIGLVYVGLLVAQWTRRRKPHQLAWAVGFVIYAVAALMEAYSEYTQMWDPTVYSIYIVLAASMVGFLGLGTLYLITKKRLLPNAYLSFVLVCMVVFFWGVLSLPLVETKVEADALGMPALLLYELKPGITVGGAALGPGGEFPRVMSLPLNITGTLLLLGGSAWSIIKFWPKKEYRYRVWANVLIIIGTLVIAGAGSMARAGQTAGLYPAEMLASAILLAGFLMAGTLERGAKAVRDRLSAGQDAAG